MKVLDILSAVGALVLAATPMTAATVAHAHAAAPIAVAHAAPVQHLSHIR